MDASDGQFSCPFGMWSCLMFIQELFGMTYLEDEWSDWINKSRDLSYKTELSRDHLFSFCYTVVQSYDNSQLWMPLMASFNARSVCEVAYTGTIRNDIFGRWMIGFISLV